MIDCHAHVFSASAPAVAGARYRPAYAASVEAWKSAWRGAGVTHGVLVQPSFFGTDNHEMVAAIESDREHLRGVAVVDSGIGDEELACLDASGVRAVRWNLRGVGDYLVYASAEWQSLLRRLHERAWHLEVFLDQGRIPEIVPALVDSPIAVVFDHFGNPGTHAAAVDATFAGAAALAANREVWCKLSGPYRLGGADRVPLARRWVETIGASRLVWGSDWPHTGYENHADYRRLRQDLDRWVGAERSGAILWDNAARLYRFT